MRGILRPSAVPRAAGPVIVARVHRTTTTATLLVTVAVSALTGCVTIQRPPASVPPRPSSAHPDGDAGPQIVQAPAREALEMIGPSRRAEPKPRNHQHRTPTATAAPAERRPAPRPSERPHPRATPPAAEPQRQPRVDIPDLTKGTDLCALGRQYGGWRADSPEAAICEQTYGR